MNLLNKYYHIITGIFVFIVYLLTIAPSVIQIDSGELAAVQTTLGIAHPTGYPIYTMIGYLFSLLPLPFTKIFQLNLLAAIYCSSAVSVFAFTIKYTLDNWSSFTKQVKPEAEKSKKKKKEKIAVENVETFSEPSKIISAIFGSLVLAFSRTFWFQSTSVEVYSLHVLLISIIILFLLNAYIISEKENETKIWFYFAVVLSLGFTNHMTTLLILPGVAYLYFLRYKLSKASVKRVLLMIGIFIPVLVVIYAYLPISTSQKPILNWGNPIDLERILRHVSGKQYQVWLFSSTEAAEKQLVYFFESLPGEFSYVLILSVIGMIVSLFKARRLFFFLLITFLSTVLYSINYDINDIDAYFLLAYFVLAFFAALSAFNILNQKNISQKISSLILTVFLIILFYLNFGKVNQSAVYTFEDYTKELIGSVPENSIILSYQWDYWLSASYYYQLVENYRRDVTIIDKELLRRSWYYDQLDNYDPELLKNLKPEIDRFRTALRPFERDEKFDANLLESLFRKIMTGIVAENIEQRDIYIAPELFENEMQKGEFILPEGYLLVPDLFLLKVVQNKNYIPAAEPDFTIRFPSNRNIYIDNIERIVGASLSRRALYEMSFGMNDRAKIYVMKIINEFPNYKVPPVLMKLLQN